MFQHELIEPPAPQSACPKCGAWQDDYDGGGVVRCEKCDYCEHPAKTMDDNGQFVCDICGKVSE